jgi:tetratricopeptide (TPR) repeat protein
MAHNKTARRWLFLGTLVMGAALAAAGWYAWRWYTTPVPPVVNLEGAEPVVAEAIESARREVLKNGRSADAWGRLGLVLRAHGYDEPSDVCFAQAERLDPKNPRWPYLQGVRMAATAPEDAMPLLRRTVELAEKADPGNEAPRYLLAEMLLRTGALDEAAEQLELLLARDRDNERVHYDLGVLAMARREDDAAIAQFRKTLQSHFARQKACAQLATLYQRRGDADAADFAQRASHLPQDLPWNDPYIMEYERLEVGQQNRFLKAERKEAEGRVAEAAQDFRDIALQFPGARSELAEGISLAKLGQYQEAEKVLRKVAEESPDLVQAQYFLGVTLYFQGEQLRERGPADSEAARAKFQEAAEHTRRATELKPDHGLAHVYLGLALRRLGKSDEAIAALELGVHCRPELIDPHLFLGEALADAGRKEEAIASLERAVEMSSESDPRARQALERLRAGDKKPEK